MIRTKHFILLHLLGGIFIQPTRSELPITWICPSEADTFSPGDIILVRWGTTDDVASPAFRLCSSKANPSTFIKDDDNTDSTGACGAAVHSLIEKGAGSFFTSLAVPNVTDENSFYLLMEDSLDVTSSPKFRISPTMATTEAARDSSTELANSPSHPSPTVVQTSSLEQGSTTRLVDAPTVSFSAVVPYLTVVHAPPPVAAYAVPLSFVGAILFAAVILAVRQHRQLKNDRSDNVEKFHCSRKSGHKHRPSYTWDPAMAPESGGGPLPNFITQTGEQHRTWQAYSAARLSDSLSGRHIPTPFGPPSRCLTPSRSSVKIDPDHSNSSVTNLILSDYGPLTPALSTSSLTLPGRLHIREQVDPSPSYFFLDPPIRRDPLMGSMLRNPISPEGNDIDTTTVYAGVHR